MSRVQLQYPEKTLCSHEVTVRLNDLGRVAHLGFDRLINIVNDASATFMEHLTVDMGGNIHTIFADLAVQYMSEAFRGDRLKIDMGVGEVFSKGFDIYFKIINLSNGRTVALAKIGLVFFNYEKRCAVAVPQAILEKI